MPGATEISLIYGGALSLQANGDLQLSMDVQSGTPQATFERVLRIVMTNPTTTNQNGTPVGRPDDLFNPNFGSGARAAVGEPFVPALVAAVTARIVGALAEDAFIVSSPAPSVQMTQLTPGTVQLTVSCTSIEGEALTLPSFTLTPLGLVTGA